MQTRFHLWHLSFHYLHSPLSIILIIASLTLLQDPGHIHKHLPALSIPGQLLSIIPGLPTSLHTLVFHSSPCSLWPAPYTGSLRTPLQYPYSNTGVSFLRACPIFCPMSFPIKLCPLLLHISSFLILSLHFIQSNLEHELSNLPSSWSWTV